MPRRINGPDLTLDQRATVLEKFPFRWTVENEPVARPLFDAHGGPPTEEPEETDDEWLANRAFDFTKTDRLVKGSGATWIGPSLRHEPWRPR